MTSPEPAPETLREMFVALSVHARPADGCPMPDRLWEAVNGELSASETEDLVVHTSACAACAETWRLAGDLSTRAPSTLAFRPRGGSFALLFRRPPALAAGIAAMVLLSIGGLYLLRRGPNTEESIYRQVEVLAIGSLLDENTPLPRERCVFKWSPAPNGTTYKVRVSREDLTIITVAENLDRAEYQVPAARLASVPAGARILWQVEALKPGGARVISPTFIAVVQ